MDEKTAVTGPAGTTRPAGTVMERTRARAAQWDTVPTSPRDDLLMVDGLMLLLMDDGAAVLGPDTLDDTLGGAVHTELALLGRVQADDPGIVAGAMTSPPILRRASTIVTAVTLGIAACTADDPDGSPATGGASDALERPCEQRLAFEPCGSVPDAAVHGTSAAVPG